MACCTNDTQSGGTLTSSYITKTIATAQIIHTEMHYYYTMMQVSNHAYNVGQNRKYY